MNPAVDVGEEEEVAERKEKGEGRSFWSLCPSFGRGGGTLFFFFLAPCTRPSSSREKEKPHQYFCIKMFNLNFRVCAQHTLKYYCPVRFF